MNSELINYFSSESSVDNDIASSSLKLSREELLEVSQKISLYYAPKRFSSFQKLVVFPIDPQHLFIYWDLGNNQAPALSEKLANNELLLQVFSEGEEDQLLYGIAIHELQAGKIIQLDTAEKSTIYFASIGSADSQHDFYPLLQSNKTQAFQSTQEEKEMTASGSFAPSDYIDFVKENEVYNGLSRIVSCFASSNHSASGKK